MKKIINTFKRAKANNQRPALSFEIFPPRGVLTNDAARETASKLVDLHPDFVSVTYSAGGSKNSNATSNIAAMLQDELDMTAMAHLTCSSASEEKIAAALDDLQEKGIENVLALRGDLVEGQTPSNRFKHATDLIPLLKERGFCVGAAAYPEAHPTVMNLDEDLKFLKAKQDAGADFFVTQLFFDNECFYRFWDKAQAAGVTAPITCGIMPVMSKEQVQRMVFMCGVSLPGEIVKILNRYADDPESLRKASIEYAANQLIDLAEHGVDGLHLYTMNKPEIAQQCMALLRGFLELMEPSNITEQHSSRGAGNTAPRFALCTLRAKAHAKPKVNQKEALRYLGYTGQAIDDSLTERLRRMAASCEEELNPAFTWRVFQLDEERCRWERQPLVVLRQSSLAFEGNSITTHLKGAQAAACLAATLGAESERKLRVLSATSPLDAMLFDACCNALIEDVAQAAQDDIAAEAAKAGLHARMRFSPGYGDLPLAVQPQFIQELDARRRLGITVGKSLLLTPAKSITAIVGLFDAPPPSTGRTPCQDCIAREYCSYLEKGITCYGNQHR